MTGIVALRDHADATKQQRPGIGPLLELRMVCLSSDLGRADGFRDGLNLRESVRLETPDLRVDLRAARIGLR